MIYLVFGFTKVNVGRKINHLKIPFVTNLWRKVLNNFVKCNSFCKMTNVLLVTNSDNIEDRTTFLSNLFESSLSQIPYHYHMYKIVRSRSFRDRCFES